MTHEDIKKALSGQGLSLAAAARAMKRSYLHLYNITTRKAKSRYVANSLAVLLDLPVAEVFPDIPEYSKPKNMTSEKAIVKGQRKLIESGLLSA